MGSLLFLADIAARRLDWSQRPAHVTVKVEPDARQQERRPNRQRVHVQGDNMDHIEPPPETDDVPTQTNAYASRLLAARRHARRKLGEDE